MNRIEQKLEDATSNEIMVGSWLQSGVQPAFSLTGSNAPWLFPYGGKEPKHALLGARTTKDFLRDPDERTKGTFVPCPCLGVDLARPN